MTMSTSGGVRERPDPHEMAASKSSEEKRASPALVSTTFAILLIMNGFIVGGLLILEVAFMSMCSRTVLRFFWSLVWTSVVAAYFYYWLIFIA
ncbi:MAG: hypothetical protein OXG05_12500 [Gammaproteobacteria bacterium]|nr:hypothetical protein [Gammaproteobacteria bacterium]